jgi:hypothetical protein
MRKRDPVPETRGHCKTIRAGFEGRFLLPLDPPVTSGSIILPVLSQRPNDERFPAS